MKRTWVACWMALSGMMLCAALAQAAEFPKRIVLISGSPAGTYYFVSTGMSKVINEKMPGTEATVEATTGSPLENMNYVAKSKTSFCMGSTDALIKAVQGDKEAGYKEPLDQLRVIMGGHTQYFYMVALADGPKTLADFKGQRLGTLTRGATIRMQLEAMLAENGLVADQDYRLVPMSYTDQMDAIKDGKIQVFTCGGGLPQAAILDLGNTHEIRLISVDKATQEKMLKAHPYWKFGDIPGGVYKGVDTPTTAILSQTILVAHADMDADFVYAMLKNFFENSSMITEIHPDGKYWSYESLIKLYDESPDLPWHEGAVRFIQEAKKAK